jgi:hypothetical protein
MKLLSIVSLILFFTSCAGPTNPFGGDILIAQEFTVDKHYTHNHDIKINSSPGKQYYNSPYDLKIKLFDPNFLISHFKYEIVYNNKKLNRWYKTEQIDFPKNKIDPIVITFKNLSILPGNINKIGFLYYPVGSMKPIVYNLKVPECYREFKDQQLHITPFDISKSLLTNIKNLSSKYQYNSSLIAALIAQESSFKPNAVSYAKALGLTQVTPTAATEIKRFKKDWNIYPNFSKIPLSKIKDKLVQKKINKDNDWRLNQAKSIEGGIVYLNYLNSYWSTPDKREILVDAFNKEIPEIDILLASYNSGAYRVKKAILKNKKDWLFDNKLKEARKYVMNIKSYCYAFNEGNINEN